MVSMIWTEEDDGTRDVCFHLVKTNNFKPSGKMDKWIGFCQRCLLR